MPADKSGQPVEPGAELFVEGRYGQQIRIRTWRRDDLQAHGQAGLVEARRNSDRGAQPAISRAGSFAASVRPQRCSGRLFAMSYKDSTLAHARGDLIP